MATATGMINRIGTGGAINGYEVLIVGDVVTVSSDDEPMQQQTVKGLSRFVTRAGDLRLGWAQLSDFEVIYIYDRSDEAFGYAVNVDAPDLSEWGYSPFSAEGDEEPTAQAIAEQ